MYDSQVAEGARFAPPKPLVQAFDEQCREDGDDSEYVWTGDRAVVNTVTWYSVVGSGTSIGSGWSALLGPEVGWAEDLEDALLQTRNYEQR